MDGDGLTELALLKIELHMRLAYTQELRDRIAQLEAALGIYGKHLERHCHPCRCGLDALLTRPTPRMR